MILLNVPQTQRTTLSPPKWKTCDWYSEKQRFRLNQFLFIGTGDVPHCTHSYKFFNTWDFLSLCPLPFLLYPHLPPASPIDFLFLFFKEENRSYIAALCTRSERSWWLSSSIFLHAEVAGAAADRMGFFTYSLRSPCPVLPQSN